MTTPTPTLSTPASTARAALNSARRYRAEWLVGIASGTVTVDNLLRHATTVDGRALTRIGLRQLIGAVPGQGDVTARRKLAILARRCGTDERRLTVGWLLDNRASGRLAAWLVTDRPDTTPRPWDGFPIAHSTEQGGSHA